jgi:DNA helicase-2/ATP-dependent DNA helicase PcrA
MQAMSPSEKAAPAQAYDQALQRLNPQQRDAVEHIEGPVMVIAGPGTGKTQILASRIGRILQHTDAQPENILCLTFTEAGVVAMRQRLQQFIGASAHRVGIYTFHGFCNLVIQENPDRFGFREAEPISELDARIQVERLLDALPKGNPLRRRGGSFRSTYFEVPRLLKLYNLMNTEGLSEESIEAAIAEHLETQKQHPDFYYKRGSKNYKKGDFKEKDYQKLVDHMETLRAALATRSPYNSIKKENGWYDFDDMIHDTLEAFKNNENLLLDYQERFQYVLVDEYQDTNGAQNGILELLVQFWERPNLFVVGDDDQAIYSFQGASLSNILNFAEHYQQAGIHMVVLKENYRSSQPILDAARALIAHNSERLEGHPGLPHIDKSLTAANSEAARNQEKPMITAWYNEAQEVVGTADAIRQLIEAGTDPGEIAVLYRKHKQAEPILEQLRRLGIPVQLKRRENLFEQPFVRQVLQLFNYLDRESRLPYSADADLFEMLHAGWTGIAPRTMAGLSWSMREGLPKRKRGYARWRDFLADAGTYGSPSGEADLFHQSDAENLQAVKAYADKIEAWLKGMRDYTLQGFVEWVLVDSGILRWVLEHKNRVDLLESLNSFFDLVRSESARRHDLDLAAFMERVASYRQHEVWLSVDRSIRSEPGVFFSSAHGSKGLEFDHVFILSADKPNWDGKGRSQTYALPPMAERSTTDEQAAIEETRRLFYVAMTRARKSLHIGFAERRNDGKDISECRFVAELCDSGLVERRAVQLPEKAVFDFWRQYVEPPLPQRTPYLSGEKARIAKLLEHYQLSVTHLNKYLRCPISFYYENILKIPAAKNRAMTFGTAVHDALEGYVKAMLADPENAWPKGVRSGHRAGPRKPQGLYRCPTALLEQRHPNRNRPKQGGLRRRTLAR